MFWIRSMSTALPLFSSGSRRWPSPGPSSISSSSGGTGWPAARGWVGVQSTSFSPISDCGRMMQEASSRKSLKPSSVMFMTTTALPGTGCGPPSRLTTSSGPVTSTDSTVPTVAPAMRTSSSLTMKPPLSKMPRTL